MPQLRKPLCQASYQRSKRSGIRKLIRYLKALINTGWKGPLTGMRKRQRGEKSSLCFLVKANSESCLCLQLRAEALGVKGVEKCPHSLLTAVEPELMGVRALRSAPMMVQSLICSRGGVRRGCSQRCYVRVDSGLLDCSSRKEPSVTTLAGHVAERCGLMGCCQPAHQLRGK